MSRIYFGTNDVTIEAHRNIEVGVFLDTEGENINALGGKIIYPEATTINNVLSGNSFISLWLTSPHATADGIPFEGIIPGGYVGSNLYLFSINLEADEAGRYVLNATDLQVLLNDGAGTPTETATSSLTLTVSEAPPETPTPPGEETPPVTPPVPGEENPPVVTPGEEVPVPLPADDAPPDVFTPVIVSNPALYDGQQVLLFLATDKGTGVAYYEVREYRPFPFWLFQSNPWYKAVSPYILHDQELRSYIEVKAVDAQGNERIMTLSPQNGSPLPLPLLAGGLLLLLLSFAVIRSVFRRRSRRT